MIKVAIILIIVLGFFQTNIKLGSENHNLLGQSSKRVIYVLNKDNIYKSDYFFNNLESLEKRKIIIYVKMPTNIKASEENLVLNQVSKLEEIIKKQKLQLQTRVFYYKLLTISNWEIVLQE